MFCVACWPAVSRWSSSETQEILPNSWICDLRRQIVFSLCARVMAPYSILLHWHDYWSDSICPFESESLNLLPPASQLCFQSLTAKCLSFLQTLGGWASKGIIPRQLFSSILICRKTKCALCVCFSLLRSFSYFIFF